jgi:sugar transferase (PEP-CTERM system associated)
VIRLFNVYYPIRTLILLVGEAFMVWASFFLAAYLRAGSQGYVLLSGEIGYPKIIAITGIVLLCSYWFDLYDPARFEDQWDLYFRLLLVPGLIAVFVGGASLLFPNLLMGRAFLVGLVILTLALLMWRATFEWLSQRAVLRERVYVLGTGDRARRLVHGLRARPDLGIEVVGWTGSMDGAWTRENVAGHLLEIARSRLHRVVVAMHDRRGTMPVRELLQLRLQGVKIEEATSWLEKMTGRIEVEQLLPSWLVFSEGFRFTPGFMVLRRALSLLLSFVLLLVIAPILPFVMLAIKLDSRGPVFYRQKRVGRGGVIFYCYNFRTMREDAEADTGPTWAGDEDPRITRVGRFLRASRLDEIPQLWNVLRGDMAFVGPRPERPEFVEWLTQEIPYYPVRHVGRPGITGWAQVQYKYGNTVDDAKEKLQFDLYYIKNASIGLDLVVVFQTVKTVLLGRGAK